MLERRHVVRGRAGDERERRVEREKTGDDCREESRRQ